MTTAPPHVNGHARPVTLQPLQLPATGPVSALPQDDPGQPRTAAGRPGRWRDAMSAFRRNWWRLVFATVGAVAAVVSYGHIVNLFLSWHAPPLDARLMPVAIDGLIIIGAGAARSGQAWLGWSAIGPGLAASLYANVMNGLPYGRGAAMGSGWATVALFLATNVMERWKAAPAVAFAGPAGMAVRFVRDARHDNASDQPVVTPPRDSDDDSKGDANPPPPPPSPPPGPPGTRQPKPSGRARAAAIVKANPGLPDAEVAKLAKMSVRTVQRARSDIARSTA